MEFLLTIPMPETPIASLVGFVGGWISCLLWERSRDRRSRT